MAILAPYLEPLGFISELKGAGKGSGGHFAYAEFSKGTTRIELHFRQSLGMVSYHVDDLTIAHQTYIDLIGKHGQNKYPGFPPEPQGSFHDLLWDLQHLLTDFTEHGGRLLKEKRPEVIARQENDHNEQKKKYSGDQRLIDRARIEFQNGRYQDVEALRQQLRHPELLTPTEKKLFELNTRKIGHA